MLTVLSGGTGTPKLLQGLARLLKPEELSVIVNTGEDLEISGLRVSPDLDTVTYTLAGIINEETWYGIRGDTFACHQMLKLMGITEMLRLGDRDRAVKLYRTLRLREGKPLSQITRELCKQLGVRSTVLPMSDDPVETRVNTEAGVQSFHEFWVVRKAKDRVLGVSFEGAGNAKPAPGVLDAIEKADSILIGPSNPVTSIGPILAVREIHDALIRARTKVLAVSPIIGTAAVSGPAGELMRGLGYEVTPAGVARIYHDVASKLMIDRSDERFVPAIEKLGVKPELTILYMPDFSARVRLAREVLRICKSE
jgi:LPPG:FO 2-phospho-L-lactate transferase